MGDLTLMHREQKTSVRDVCSHKKKGSYTAFMNNETVRGYANQLSHVTRKENLKWSVVGGRRNGSAIRVLTVLTEDVVQFSSPMSNNFTTSWNSVFFFFFVGGPRGLFWLLQ